MSFPGAIEHNEVPAPDENMLSIGRHTASLPRTSTSTPRRTTSNPGSTLHPAINSTITPLWALWCPKRLSHDGHRHISPNGMT